MKNLKNGKVKFLIVGSTILLSLVILLSFCLTRENNILTLLSKMAGSEDNQKIQLVVKTHEDDPSIPENTAELSWNALNDYQSIDYVIKRGVNDKNIEHFSQIFALPENPIQVLNVYPDASVRNKDGSVTYAKDLLHNWMQVNKDSEGNTYGKGLINVTTMSLTDFNSKYNDCLSSSNEETCKIEDDKDTENVDEYKFDIIFFGTWDSNHSEDLKEDSAKAVEKFIKAGHSVIFGHDTIANIGNSGSLYHPNFVTLAKYVQITAGKEWDSSHNHDTDVFIFRDGVFTTYPWNIGSEGSKLVIPNAHNLGQTANGNIWLQFDNKNAWVSTTDRTYEPKKNFYLTTGQCTENDCKNEKSELPATCAMIQTGHSSGQATSDEQKIIANLIFYLWYQSRVNTNTSLTDQTFVDTDAPKKPTVKENGITTSIDGENSKATVNLETNDVGTHYRWEIEAYDNAKKGDDRLNSKLVSNVIEKTRITGVKKYQYYIDDSATSKFCKNEPTDPQDCIKDEALTTVEITSDNETDATIDLKIEDITIGDKLQTYLHIRALDGAGNASEQTDVLVYTDLAPQVNIVSKTPTIWTNGEVAIDAKATDKDGIVTKIEDSSINKTTTRNARSINDSLQLIEKQNGTYSVTATDNAGKTGTANVTISNIDNDLPTIGEFNITKEKASSSVKIANVRVLINDVTSGIQNVDLVCGSTKKNIEQNSHINDGTYKGYQNQTLDFVLTDTELSANNGVCSLEVTDYAGNKTTKEIKVSSKVIVKYRDHYHHDRDELESPLVKDGYVGESYTTEPVEIPGYRFMDEATPSNQNGKYTVEDQTIYYEYVKQFTINIKKVDVSDLTKEIGSETPSFVGDEGVHHIVDAPKVSGYKAVGYYIGNDTTNIVNSTSVNQVLNSDVTITFVYDKLSTVTVIYEDKDTEVEIGSKEVIYNDEEETKTYRFEAEHINNYTLVGYKIDDGEYQEITDDKQYVEITMGTKPVKITFYYKEHSEGLLVKYVDKVTNGTLKQKTYTGDVGDEITLDKTEIEGYELVEMSLDGKDIEVTTDKVTLAEAKHEVVLYYRKKITLNIVGKDAITNETLYSNTQDGLEGEEYSITAPTNFEKYNLYRLQGSNTKAGTYDRDEVTLVFYYNRISAGVKVQYIDKDTGDIIEEKIINGVEGQTYTTVQNTYEKYDFVEIDGIGKGTMTIDEIVVKYYYTKKMGKVIVKYEDIDGNVIDTKTYTDKIEKEFNISLEGIYGYEYKELIEGSLTGTYTIEDQVVRVLVERMKSKIIVRYVDEDGNVLDTLETEDYVGEKILIETPEFEGYVVDSKAILEATYEENDATIDILYKKIEEEDTPNTLDNSLQVFTILTMISLFGITISMRKLFE